MSLSKRLMCFFQVLLGVAFISIGLNAQAVRMGALTVESALGEPLRASIRLYDVEGITVDAVTVSMASPSAYDSLGLIYNDLISRINLQYDGGINGPQVRLSTQEPVNEVVLDLQVELVGPQGKVSKTYVAFIDPPFLVDERLSLSALESELLDAEEFSKEMLTGEDIDISELLVGSVEPDLEPVVDELVRNAESIASKPNIIDQVKDEASEITTLSDRQIVVRPGDTLTKIAQREGLSDFSLEQMLVGIFRKNREAFVGDNMNRLRAGNVVRIPLEDELQTISEKEATSEIQIHMADWRAYKDSLAVKPRAQRQPIIERADRSKSGVVEGGSDQVNIQAQSDNTYVVEVSTGRDDGNLGSQVLEERLLATEKALDEQKKRADELENIIADLKSLVQSQQDLGSITLPEDERGMGGSRQSIREDLEAPWQAKIIEAVLRQPFYLLVPILFLLIVGLWVSKRLNRLDDNDSTHEAIQPAVKKNDEVGFREPTGSKEPGEANVLRNQDPVEDADIFLAYSRYPQAEKILKEALIIEPDRLDVLLKLAEVYSRQKALTNFDSVAELIANITSKTGAYWERLVALGYLTDPTDERYADGKFASEGPASIKPVDLSSIDLDLGKPPPPKS